MNSSNEKYRSTMRLLIDGEQFLLELYDKYVNGETDEQIKEWWKSIQPDDLEPLEVFEPSSSQMKLLREDFQKSIDGNRAGKALKIQEWYKNHPHLPQPPLGMIHKFLWAAKEDEEQCKKVLSRFFTLRGADDEIFGNRDPCSPGAKLVYESSHFACLPIFTPELYRINLSVLTDHDPEKFCPREWVRRIFYLADLRVRDDFCLGDVMIYDLKGFSLQHLLKFQIALAKKMIVAAEGGLPTRIKQIHLINSPPFIDKITALFKPFLKEKMAQRVVVHMDNNYDELYKYISKEYLPEEYGGTAGCFADYSRMWIKEFERNKDWFMREEKNVKRIYMEGRKNGKIFVDCGELFGMEGSFKKLSID